MVAGLKRRDQRASRSSSPVVRRPNLRGALQRGRRDPSQEPETPNTSTPQMYTLTPEIGTPDTNRTASRGESATVLGTTEAALKRNNYLQALENLRRLHSHPRLWAL